ncbi:hypothetical protein BVRB_020740 [Beta vulgaris subsp. vulgaris]|uniref:Uncharacterized protein n=1 Tax=Beta vulgaris subsp. vulgaris TaxID=3555 RepID=A0A0J8DUN5_BETVV|nr:hypothetical protein BVRB_020740 [Beta vulgaris subsp. vulgaris]
MVLIVHQRRFDDLVIEGPFGNGDGCYGKCRDLIQIAWIVFDGHIVELPFNDGIWNGIVVHRVKLLFYRLKGNTRGSRTKFRSIKSRQAEIDPATDLEEIAHEMLIFAIQWVRRAVRNYRKRSRPKRDRREIPSELRSKRNVL